MFTSSDNGMIAIYFRTSWSVRSQKRTSSRQPALRMRWLLLHLHCYSSLRLFWEVKMVDMNVFPGIVSDLLNSGSFHAQLAGSPLYHSLSVIRGDWILSFLQLQRQSSTLSCFQMNLHFHTQHVFRKLSWLSSMIFTESPFFCLLLQHLTNIPNLFFLQIQLAATLIFSRTWWGR